MYFEIYQEGSGLLSLQWRWRLRAANNEIIASGEGYNNKQDCIHAVDLVKSTSAATPVKQP